MKNIFGLVLLIVLLAAAYWIYKNEGLTPKGNSEVLKDFAIEDTAKIDKIRMSQPNGKEILISRRNQEKWMVNGKIKAREDAINLILKTIHDVQVQSGVSQKTFDGVVKRLATSHTKVEIYQGGQKPEKVWYIGDPTPSRLGAYTLLEKKGKISSKPFVTHMVMERGYLGSRFFLDPNLWRDPLIMRCNPKEIKSIEIWHNVDTATGFKIKQLENNKFEIKGHKENEWKSYSMDKAIPFFKEFNKVHYEYIDAKTEQSELDSIYSSPYRHKIEIVLQDGKEIHMRTYFMPVAKGATLGGKPINYHPERMYAYTSELGKESHPVVQNFTFDPLVPSYEDLESLTIVEK